MTAIYVSVADGRVGVGGREFGILGSVVAS